MFVGKKILVELRLYWHTLFAQVGEKVGSCTQFQMFVGKKILVELPLVPVLVQAPSLKRGLDFISEIYAASRSHHRWI